ncbi:MAG: hypothetical protein RLZZ283_516 [Candidatus Parcubacteria bacterium]|jgi:lipopolysaccharide/colanic/teichoic acid biosynthesis glycosyltransferase
MPKHLEHDKLILFIGDALILVGGLWLALFTRHFEMVSVGWYLEHLLPFSILFVLWLVVFVIVGLYDTRAVLLGRRLPVLITEAQIVNFCLAALFFFFAPIAIQPKTVLLLYFCFSTLLFVVWRMGAVEYAINQRARAHVEILGDGEDIELIRREMAQNDRVVFPPGTRIVDPRLRVDPSPGDISAAEVYEMLFERVSLDMLDHASFISDASRRESRVYDVLKRVMDASAAVLLGVLSLVIYPCALFAIWSEDGRPFFVFQERVGKNGQPFSMAKFRSMTGNDSGTYGDDGKTKLRVTRVGSVLRKSRIDELPQLWSVVVGAQSLIGPRPELPALVETYTRDIPHYALRHLVTPGLSGWAQIYHDAHPHHGADVVETKNKLSYDLYYIKHRSLFLDIEIALKTVKTLALRVGA